MCDVLSGLKNEQPFVKDSIDMIFSFEMNPSSLLVYALSRNADVYCGFSCFKQFFPFVPKKQDAFPNFESVHSSFAGQSILRFLKRFAVEGQILQNTEGYPLRSFSAL